MAKSNQTLTAKGKEDILKILKERFGKNKNRHKDLVWEEIQIKLEKHPDKLWSISEMERTEGEPDVIGFDKSSGRFLFADCSPESPKGRRSICYDKAALEARKEHKPKNSAMEMAKDLGIEILNETEYRDLQELGEFDLKTSSWVLTPDDIRKKGGAIFCDRRYGKVFTYHNGADSYYAARGFRGILKV